ncbi:MAG: O-methyltransferase [Chloroflexi bacterium]|nr:O-methyltransferase [Chloroflexota bacterium]
MAITEAVRTQLDAYINDLFAPEDDALRWIQAETARQELPKISIRPHEGRLLQFLVCAVGARTAVELGTLAGYSGTWIARALPPDGRLYTLELSEKHAAVARASFARAGVAERVTVLVGPALDSLAQLSPDGPVDFIFIDADKAAYGDYLAWAVAHLRPGGIIAAHNALRGGRIVAPENADDHTMIAFNQALADDPRLDSLIIGVGDGMAVARKR